MAALNGAGNPTGEGMRLGDRLLHLGRIAIGAVKEWINDGCSSMSAAVAFYAAFSLAPMLVIIIAVAGAFFGAEAVQGRLFGSIAGLIGKEGAVAIQAMVASAWKAGASGWTAVISLIAIVIGASATFSELNSALNIIWRDGDGLALKKARSSGLFGLLRIRLLSFGLVVGVGFLTVVLLVMDAALGWLTEFIWPVDGVTQTIARLLQGAVSLAGMAAAFAILLKVLPDRRIDWRTVVYGAVTAALLFTAGKSLFGMYLARAGTANAFGAAGSLAVVLMWMYYSAAIFFLAAEVAAVGKLSARNPADGKGEATARETRQLQQPGTDLPRYPLKE